MHISALHGTKARTLMEEPGSETSREPRKKPDFSYVPPIIYLMLGIEHMESMANCQ